MQFLKGDIQERILKVAEEVFLEKGYKDASMREIASRAGVTVSNIYHYFTNKDEIFRTILKPVLNDLYAMILQSPNQKIPDRKTKCVIKTHINIKQNVIFGAKLKPV